MGRAALLRPHLVQVDFDARPCRLPCRLASGKAASNYRQTLIHTTLFKGRRREPGFTVTSDRIKRDEGTSDRPFLRIDFLPKLGSFARASRFTASAFAGCCWASSGFFTAT